MTEFLSRDRKTVVFEYRRDGKTLTAGDRTLNGDETRCCEWFYHQDMKCTPYLSVHLDALAALSEPVPEGGPAGGGRTGMEGPPTVRGRIPRPGNGSKKPDPGIGLDWRRDWDSNPSYDHS